MKKVRDAHGREMWEGEGEIDRDLLSTFDAHIERRAPLMHKCLDAANSLLRYCFARPIEEIPEDHRQELEAYIGREVEERGINMTGAFDALEKEFGVELSLADRNTLFACMLDQFEREGGISLCASWQVAHVIEHLCGRTLQ